jgi:hypothetical protein
MKKTFPLLLLTLSLASAAMAVPTTIKGLAKDGSNGGKPLPNATVNLVRPGDKGAKTMISTTRTDAQGRFAFPARQYSDKDLLMAVVDRGGFEYVSVAYDGGNTLKQVGITVDPNKVDLLVFNTSTQPVPIDFQAHHLALKSTEKGLHCIERIVVHNHSNLTFMGVGPRKLTVLLNIPKIAKNIKLDSKTGEATLVQTKDGWGISKPITPDAYGVSNALIFSYDVEWPSSLPWAKSVDLSRETIYPTKFFFVARETDDKGLQVSAPKLSPDTEAEIPIDGQSGKRIVNSVGAPMMPEGGAPPALPKGQELIINISRPVNPTFWGFAAMTVALCLFLPLAMIKPRRGAAKSTSGRNFSEPSNGALVSEQTYASGAHFSPLNGFGTDLALNASSRDLIQKIADLDDSREAGQIGEEEYQSRRAAWKKQLIESLGTSQGH